MKPISVTLTSPSFLVRALTIGLLSTVVMAASSSKPANPVRVKADSGEAEYRQQVQPLFKTYCYSCHGDGEKSGDIALDGDKSYAAVHQNHKLFQKVLKNLRSGLMPPPGMPQPTADEKGRIAQWIKTRVFDIDLANPDPGRVTVHRLNRVEYRNTVRDLLGVDYDTQIEFPPDDAGHGFDNISDVLTLSPMLMEKYINAAQAIVAQAVPTTSHVEAETEIPGSHFVSDGASAPTDDKTGFHMLSYYEPATVSNTFQIAHPGSYQLVLDLTANEKYVDNKFDYNRCRLIVRADGQELLREELNREGGKKLHYAIDQKWTAGAHTVSFEVQPLTPGVEQIRTLTLRIDKVTLRGPSDVSYEVEPPNYHKFFPRPVPAGSADRRVYARDILGRFAGRAFRRPADPETLSRLVDLAESVYTQPGQSFEAGISQAMVAVLASPRFLFREEGIATAPDSRPYAEIDEYALASRLSYFLWSSMPDDELFQLARQGQLRKNLPAQVQRMLSDRRSEALIDNFSGQWLQARDIETVAINPFAVAGRDRDPAAAPPAGNFRFSAADRQRFTFDEPLRKDLQSEVHLYFGHIVRDDRSVLELVDSNYTFLNARLAKYYGLTDLGVTGDQFRQVTLPADCPRGGVITMGSVLAVTSNPTRTSPVKRGLFILDNILGAPAPPPPPNIPPLEAAADGLNTKTPTSREILAAHRNKPACMSCHNRLDPPGLALENFNAMGMWREKEFGQPIESAGTLVTGEPFKNVRELKQILASKHSTEFYRCLTEKLFTYALGRGLEDYDTESVDRIVRQLQQSDGRFSTLLTGVIESAPFQKCRIASATAVASTPRHAQQQLSLGTRLNSKSTQDEGNSIHGR